jgi:hypothetical protein
MDLNWFTNYRTADKNRRDVEVHKNALEVSLDFGSCTEVIAVFNCEDAYMACVPSLTSFAKSRNAVLIEKLT